MLPISGNVDKSLINRTIDHELKAFVANKYGTKIHTDSSVIDNHDAIINHF